MLERTEISSKALIDQTLEELRYKACGNDYPTVEWPFANPREAGELLGNSSSRYGGFLSF